MDKNKKEMQVNMLVNMHSWLWVESWRMRKFLMQQRSWYLLIILLDDTITLTRLIYIYQKLSRCLWLCLLFLKDILHIISIFIPSLIISLPLSGLNIPTTENVFDVLQTNLKFPHIVPYIVERGLEKKSI